MAAIDWDSLDGEEIRKVTVFRFRPLMLSDGEGFTEMIDTPEEYRVGLQIFEALPPALVFDAGSDIQVGDLIALKP